MITYVTKDRNDTPNSRGLHGKVGDLVRVVRFSNSHVEGSNAFVARYEWVEKTLRSETVYNRYVLGGWFPLHRGTTFTVGLWTLVYCGPEHVDPASVVEVIDAHP